MMKMTSSSWRSTWFNIGFSQSSVCGPLQRCQVTPGDHLAPVPNDLFKTSEATQPFSKANPGIYVQHYRSQKREEAYQSFPTFSPFKAAFAVFWEKILFINSRITWILPTGNWKLSVLTSAEIKQQFLFCMVFALSRNDSVSYEFG